MSFASIEGCEVPETPVDSGTEGPPAASTGPGMGLGLGESIRRKNAGGEGRGRGGNANGRGAGWMGLRGLGWVFGREGGVGEVVG